MKRLSDGYNVIRSTKVSPNIACVTEKKSSGLQIIRFTIQEITLTLYCGTNIHASFPIERQDNSDSLQVGPQQ